MQNKDTIYPKQFLLLSFIASLTFKMVMLPQYLCREAGRNAYLTMLYMMVIELLMLAIIYGTISHGGLLQLNIPKPFKYCFCILILASCFMKCGVLTSQ